MFQFVFIAFCSNSGHHWEETNSCLCTFPACVLTGSLKIPLLQPQQTPLLQPLHTVQVLQSLHHLLHSSLLDSLQHACALPR